MHPGLQDPKEVYVVEGDHGGVGPVVNGQGLCMTMVIFRVCLVSILPEGGDIYRHALNLDGVRES